MAWNPTQYLQYEDARLRPALDLIARVPLESARKVVDLGCGAGNVATWLARRYPEATITGVDGDPAMLERARKREGRFEFVQADLAQWTPVAAVDLVFSNAALQWLPAHEQLLPKLMQQLVPGGVLAVQMPDNYARPSHTALYRAAREPRFRPTLDRHIRAEPVAPLAAYHQWLAPMASALDLWETDYLHHLPPREDGEHPVVAWVRGSSLGALLAHLSPDEGSALVDDYAMRILRAYPLRPDGSVLFPFRRVFIVATRQGGPR